MESTLRRIGGVMMLALTMLPSEGISGTSDHAEGEDAALPFVLGWSCEKSDLKRTLVKEINQHKLWYLNTVTENGRRLYAVQWFDRPCTFRFYDTPPRDPETYAHNVDFFVPTVYNDDIISPPPKRAKILEDHLSASIVRCFSTQRYDHSGIKIFKDESEEDFCFRWAVRKQDEISVAVAINNKEAGMLIAHQIIFIRDNVQVLEF